MEVRQKPYVPEWVIAVSQPFEVITISNSALRKLFEVSLNETNFQLVKQNLGTGKQSA